MKKEILSPGELALRINDKISKQVRTAFFAALVIGFITHAYGFIHLMPNHDGVQTSLIHMEDMLYQGRWFQKYVSLLTSSYSMPWVNGLFSLLALALSAALTVWLFGFKRRIGAALAAGILVTFPAVTSAFGYLYMADAFTFALLLSVFAVYVSRRFPKFGFLVSAVLICLSLGIYQSYICVSVALYVSLALFDVLSREKKPVKIVVQGIKDIASLAGGAVLYLLVLNIILSATGTELTDYQNIESLGSGAQALNFLPQIKETYKGFAQYITDDLFSLYNPFAGWIHISAAVAAAVLAVYIYVKQKLYKSLFESALFFVIAALLPMAFYSIALISAGIIHMVMICSVCVAYMAAIKLFEMSAEVTDKVSLKNALKWAGVIAFSAVIASNFFLANKSYLSLQAKYNQTYAYAAKLSARIESSEEYTEGMPVAIAGYTKTFDYPPAVITGFNFNGKYIIHKPERYYNFFRDYIGADYDRVDNETLNDLTHRGEFFNMPLYPEAGSIKEIDGVLVVKLGD